MNHKSARISQDPKIVTSHRSTSPQSIVHEQPAPAFQSCLENIPPTFCIPQLSLHCAIPRPITLNRVIPSAQPIVHQPHPPEIKHKSHGRCTRPAPVWPCTAPIPVPDSLYRGGHYAHSHTLRYRPPASTSPISRTKAICAFPSEGSITSDRERNRRCAD
jgi:hypothetical protein